MYTTERKKLATHEFTCKFLGFHVKDRFEENKLHFRSFGESDMCTGCLHNTHCNTFSLSLWPGDLFCQSLCGISHERF